MSCQISPRLRCRGQGGELLRVQDTLADQRQEQEFNQVTARLKGLETAFLPDLDRVDRGVMTEPEYLKQQEVRRSEQAALEPRNILIEKIIFQDDADHAATTIPPRPLRPSPVAPPLTT